MNTAPQGPVRPQWALEDLTVESLQLLWLADELEEGEEPANICMRYHGMHDIIDRSVAYALIEAKSPNASSLAVDVAVMALRLQAFSLQKRKLL